MPDKQLGYYAVGPLGIRLASWHAPSAAAAALIFEQVLPNYVTRYSSPRDFWHQHGCLVEDILSGEVTSHSPFN